MKRICLLLVGFCAVAVSAAEKPALQQAIDRAPEGAVIEIGAGVYAGNLTINKPLTLKAVEKGAVIRGDGKDSVITVKSSFVTITGLTIEKSGLPFAEQSGAECNPDFRSDRIQFTPLFQ